MASADNPSRERILGRVRSAVETPAPAPRSAPRRPFFAPVTDPLERFERECEANKTELILATDEVASAAAVESILDSLPAGEVFVQSFPSSSDRQQVSAHGGAQPRWKGDGRELYFISPRGEVMAAEISAGPKLVASAPRVLFVSRILPLVEARNNYDVTPDGQRFLVNSRRPEDAALPITVVAPWQSGGAKR